MMHSTGMTLLPLVSNSTALTVLQLYTHTPPSVEVDIVEDAEETLDDLEEHAEGGKSHL